MSALPRFALRGALAGALLLTACAAEPPKAPVRDPNLVSVTVFRPHSDLHPSDYPFVWSDKSKQGTLADNGSVTFDVPAGIHRFSLSNPALWDSEQSWTLGAVAARHYWFRLALGEADGPEGSLSRYVSRFARVDEIPEDRLRPVNGCWPVKSLTAGEGDNTIHVKFVPEGVAEVDTGKDKVRAHVYYFQRIFTVRLDSAAKDPTDAGVVASGWIDPEGHVQFNGPHQDPVLFSSKADACTDEPTAR